MAFVSTVAFLRQILVTALLLTILVEARPRPKAAWIRGARARLAKSSNINRAKRAIDNSTCHEAAPPDFKAPHQNVWSGLTSKEAASVTKWLFAQKELNLTVADNATDWTNSILQVELMIPNKTDVLAYVDGDAQPPTRYAHVVLAMQASEQPTYNDILVGPLPVSNTTTSWQPLEYPFTRKTGGAIRNLDADEESINQWLFNVSSTISDITLDLWNATALGLKNDSMSIWGKDFEERRTTS
jgi:primary-amine oxidase